MPDASKADHPMGGECCTRSIDAEVAALAAAQHGVVGRPQLTQLGLTARMIDHLLARCRLHSIHRGVYAVGHPRLTRRGRWMAAVLASGDGAVLSHRSAAALWGLVQSDRVEVTTPKRGRRRAGVTIRWSELPRDETTTRDGIPVTTVSRTLFDLAAVAAPATLRRAARSAEAQRLGDGLSLADLLARHPRRPGAAALRDLAFDGRVVRSELEERFLAFLDRAGLPRPATNVQVCGYECDCVWFAERVIVELDGRAGHHGALAFEEDRERDRVLSAAGWRPVRVTWRHVHRGRRRLAADLAAMLLSGAAAGPPRAPRAPGGPERP